MEEGTEFIPLMSAEDEEKMHKEEIPDELPILPVRNTVLIPWGCYYLLLSVAISPLTWLKMPIRARRLLAFLLRRTRNAEEPDARCGFHYGVGTVAARFLKMLKMPDGSSTVIIQELGESKLRSLHK